MVKKKQRSQKKRSEKKILDAFHHAERQQNGYGSGSDESDDGFSVRDGIMDARQLSKEPHGGKNDPLTDEEIDSDEAFGSDHELDVLESKFSHSLREKKKGDRESEAESDDSENEGYESLDETQLVTLSEAWDLDDRDLNRQKKNALVLKESESDTASESESESDSESGSSSESESGSESESESEILRGSDDEVELSSTRKTIASSLPKEDSYRKLISEKRDDSEYAVPAGSQKLSLAEMMGTQASEAPLIDVDGGKDQAPVAVPLPRKVQERFDRRAAYEMTKQDLNKWKDSVRQLNESDQVQFPLVKHTESDQEVDETDLQFVGEQQQKNELENKVEALLRAGALLDEGNEQRFEQIEAAKLSKEDMMKRTQELRRMRELMFRDEQRAKRIKKIKSKQYHKIKKRERLRDAELVDEAEGVSSGDDQDMKRAEERMSLRHKTQGKWAKSMIKAGITKDASTRADLEEMLRSGERLRARKMGHADGEHSDDDVSDIERDVARDNTEDEAHERGLLGKGVLAMGFMKNAEEKRRKENQRELDFLKGMRDGSGIEEFQTESTSINKESNQGRRSYSQKVNSAKAEMEQLDEAILHDYRDDEASNLVSRMQDRRNDAREVQAEEFEGFSDNEQGDKQDEKEDNREEREKDNQDEKESENENPWITDAPVQKSKKMHVVDNTSSRLAKSANKIAKHAEKNKPKAKNAENLVDLDHVMHLSGDVHGSDGDSDGDGEVRMFRQTELIKEAFAGDDVVSEFTAEKRKLVDEEGDKEEDLTLPGWGGWGGAGMGAKPKKKFTRKIDGVPEHKRKDRKLDRVIINESATQANSKYQATDVPFPFETREQYEQSLRMPIGEQWASKATFQKSITPKISIRQGEVIDPMTAPFH